MRLVGRIVERSPRSTASFLAQVVGQLATRDGKEVCTETGSALKTVNRTHAREHGALREIRGRTADFGLEKAIEARVVPRE
jgi:hypothetical protein